MKERRKGMLLVVSGPSGTGKGTLCERLLRSDPTIMFGVSATTRKPREGEIDGVHYHFIDEERFDKMLAEKAFLEHATVHGHRYGTPKDQVERAIEEGRNILLDIEDKGLADALEFVVVNGDESSVVESWDSVAGQAQNLGELLASQGKRIIAAPYGQLDEEGATDYFALVVHMREDAGNQFQGKNIIINVTVVATQAAVESDSFDNKYDAGASFPVTTSEDLAKA